MKLDVGKLLSLVSHELRNPLGVMRGYMRMLDQQGTELGAPHRPAVSASLRATDRAAEILDQLSTVAKFLRGEVAVSRRPVELLALLRSAADAAETPRDPSVTVHVEATPVIALQGDIDLLSQAFAKLTSAVAKARVADGQVRLGAADAVREGRRGVVIEITSLDPGEMSEEHMLDAMRGGLGLDLPIAACIVDAHGGSIRERRASRRLGAIVVWLPQAGESVRGSDAAPAAGA